MKANFLFLPFLNSEVFAGSMNAAKAKLFMTFFLPSHFVKFDS